MGIDYDNCSVCGRIFPDCDDYGACGGCEATWCENCTSRVECFSYAGHDCCSLCYSDEPTGIPTKLVLRYALHQLGKTREDIEQEMAKIAAYDEYTKPVASYTCQDKRPHVCAPACTTLGDDWDVQVAPPESDLTVVRGLCCLSKWPDAEDEEHWCPACMDAVMAQEGLPAKKSKSE